ncbi:hypothetical protein [Nucisporomicrobium flavum]|jgi:hypothetical protein|uniref:hypothetical protein n=1 Tax=Nucisporomicrobium flavum TaxID=2785915 RepID=UPI0018F432EB|nr:hypothetical protein [Nucisporomicrobium flavum]
MRQSVSGRRLPVAAATADVVTAVAGVAATHLPCRTYAVNNQRPGGFIANVSHRPR